jgi:glutamate racemase
MTLQTLLPSAPIGVFDSGVGGLSVLRALRAALPHERFVYLADSANAPYGERGDTYVSARTHAITHYLLDHHHIKALVVACNTATAAAIHEVRSAHAHLPLVGLEPALKPALALTHTGRVGVIGTRGTLTSRKFNTLLASLEGQAQFVVQPCDGLAHAIERSVDLPVQEGNSQQACGARSAPSPSETGALCQRYLAAMGAFGTQQGEIDTLVLGCTHYVFVEHELRRLVGPDVKIIETGEAVARQTRRLLETAGLLQEATLATGLPGAADGGSGGGAQETASEPGAGCLLLTTGPLTMLQAGAYRWLGLPADCCVSVSVPG